MYPSRDTIDPPVQAMLRTASAAVKTASRPFYSRIFNSPWDQFVMQWAPIIYDFVGHALGEYGMEPLPEILPMSDGEHSAGATASFNPTTGQVRLSGSVENKPGQTLEKLTHEF